MKLLRACLCLLAAPVAWADAVRVPVEHFFQNPAISGARLSDDGRRLVMRVPHESGRMSVGMLDLETKRASLVVVPGDYDVDYVLWKDDLILFGGDAGGNESYSLRSIKPDGTGLRDLNESYDPLRPVRTGAIGARRVSNLRTEPGQVLIQGYGVRFDSEGWMEPSGVYGFYRLNVRTGRRTLVEAVPEKALGYYADDASGRVYGRLMPDGDDSVLELRAPGEKEFVFVARFPGAEEYLDPVGLLPGTERCLMLIRGGAGFDRATLAEYDLRTGKQVRVAFSPPAGEITDVLRSRRGELWGVRVEAERPHYVWFNPTLGRLHASLQATFPGKVVELVDSSLDDNVLLFFVYSDRDPGAYYVWNQKKPGLLAVGKALPKIDPAQMAERTPISYAARDGLTIHGYLTRPVGAKGPVPLVLLPHGGPYGPRDSWPFDNEAQFLANRGYAVLQVNFRGSGGYGFEFQSAGRKEWGGKMQDDLTDAVRWAIAEKITTADNVGIMGASYGGYATLAGLVYTPELYRCGINSVGVTDLRFLAKSTTWKGHGYRMFTGAWIGDDPKYLEERSPVNFVERIRVPTLHAYGEKDPRVDIQHWRALESALKRHGKTYEYLRDEESGHGFQDEKTRLQYYRRVEDFLAKYLPADGAHVRMDEVKVLEMPARN
jgi:dienelactone hydrolase